MNRRGGKLEERVAIVTGAGRGIGSAIARLLAAEGGRVVAADIDGDQAEATAADIRSAGGSADGMQVDVRIEARVVEMAAAAVDNYGSIDILVNCAGVLRATRVDEIAEAEWDLVVDVNLKGTFLCSKAVLPAMKERGFGRIVNISSSAGRSVSTLGGAHYTAAKAGVLGFTRALAKEAASFGITANSICPGLIDTEMVRENCSPERLKAYEESFPVGRLGSPSEIAQLALFLVSDTGYITGAAIDINGGDLMI